MNAEEEDQDSQGEEVGGVFQTEVWYVGAVDEVQASDEEASATRNPCGEVGTDPEVGSATARPGRVSQMGWLRRSKVLST